MGSSSLSGVLLLGVPDFPRFSTNHWTGGAGAEWAWKSFTPSRNSIVVHGNGPISSACIYISTGVSGLSWGQGITRCALSGVAPSGFVSDIRVIQGDRPPQSGIV